MDLETKINANPEVYKRAELKRESGGLDDLLGEFDKIEPLDAAEKLPLLYAQLCAGGEAAAPASGETGEMREPFDGQEIFDLIRDISDPEHPHSLEELKVLSLDSVTINDEASAIHIQFTPTIPHCSMSTLIGLCIRVQLLRCLPRRFKVDVTVTPGSHASEHQVNKQLNDKERVAAALENASLLEVVNRCIAGNA